MKFPCDQHIEISSVGGKNESEAIDYRILSMFRQSRGGGVLSLSNDNREAKVQVVFVVEPEQEGRDGIGRRRIRVL